MAEGNCYFFSFVIVIAILISIPDICTLSFRLWHCSVKVVSFLTIDGIVFDFLWIRDRIDFYDYMKCQCHHHICFAINLFDQLEWGEGVLCSPIATNSLTRKRNVFNLITRTSTSHSNGFRKFKSILEIPAIHVHIPAVIWMCGSGVLQVSVDGVCCIKENKLHYAVHKTWVCYINCITFCYRFFM